MHNNKSIMAEIKEKQSDEIVSNNIKEGKELKKYFEEYLSTSLDDMEYDDAIKKDKRSFGRFFLDYLEHSIKQRPPRRYEPIYWWYRFGIAKDSYLNGNKIGPEDFDNYKMMADWRFLMRKKYYKIPRKRNKIGQKDYYEFSENESYKIPLLDSIGMIWDIEEEKWNNFYSMLCQYYKDMGHTFVTPTYVTKEGFRLGYYVSKIIKRKNILSPEQKELLKAVEFPYRLMTITGTSFWEQALYYYVKQWNNDAQNRKKVGGYELDVFIPGPPKIAIEYEEWR